MSRVAVATLDELGDVPLGVEMPEADLELALVRIGDEVFAIRDECSHGKVRLSEHHRSGHPSRSSALIAKLIEIST